VLQRRAAGEAPTAEEAAQVERLLAEFGFFQYNGSVVFSGLTATSVYPPALMPPMGGTLAASPTFGTALTTNFVFTSGGLQGTNGAALSPTVPTDKVMAGELLMPPLHDDLVTALLPVALRLHGHHLQTAVNGPPPHRAAHAVQRTRYRDCGPEAAT
jgi:hypothetical protein